MKTKKQTWEYLPMVGRVRTRVNTRTGEVQRMTVDSGIRGWRREGFAPLPGGCGETRTCG